MKTLNTYITEGGVFKNINAEIVTPENKKELIKIINDTIEKEGPNCDLNFIDTSKIDDMSALFYSSKFNKEKAYLSAVFVPTPGNNLKQSISS